MAKKELDAILEAEKAAAEAIENAKAKAKEMLTASEKEAERILRDALDSAQSEAKALSLEASETVSGLEAEILKEAQEEVFRLTDIANKRFDEAVNVIVSRVKKAV